MSEPIPPPISPHDRWLWVAMAAGPIAWFIDLTASYFATPGAYERRTKLPLHLISLVCVLITIAAGAYSAVYLSRTPESDAPKASRARFLAILALGFSVLSLLLVLAMAVPKWWLASGAEP